MLSDQASKLKLIDFNVAVDFAQCPEIRGKTGTDEFSAPETRKWISYDEKCDMWSVGCLILFMLTGTWPPYGDLKVWQTNQLPKDCGEGHLLDDLLMRLLDQNPDSRISC